MRKPLLVMIVVCLAATLAVAQAQPPASVCEIHINKVKPGATAQYEQGRAKHMAWHKSQNDPWTWNTWEITTGENTGNFLIASCDHAWKDFDGRDKFQAADSANATATVVPHQAGQTMSYYVARPDLAPPTPPGPPPPYLTVLHFFLKPEGITDFADAVKKIRAGMEKTNYPLTRSNWYSLASGGRGPEFVLVTERKGLAELQGPAKTLDAMMQEAYGDQGAATLASLRKAYYSSYSELLRLRPELSYMPATPPKP